MNYIHNQEGFIQDVLAGLCEAQRVAFEKGIRAVIQKSNDQGFSGMCDAAAIFDGEFLYSAMGGTYLSVVKQISIIDIGPE